MIEALCSFWLEKHPAQHPAGNNSTMAFNTLYRYQKNRIIFRIFRKVFTSTLFQRGWCFARSKIVLIKCQKSVMLMIFSIFQVMLSKINLKSFKKANKKYRYWKSPLEPQSGSSATGGNPSAAETLFIILCLYEVVLSSLWIIVYHFMPFIDFFYHLEYNLDHMGLFLAFSETYKQLGEGTKSI